MSCELNRNLHLPYFFGLIRIIVILIDIFQQNNVFLYTCIKDTVMYSYVFKLSE